MVRWGNHHFSIGVTVILYNPDCPEFPLWGRNLKCWLSEERKHIGSSEDPGEVSPEQCPEWKSNWGWLLSHPCLCLPRSDLLMGLLHWGDSPLERVGAHKQESLCSHHLPWHPPRHSWAPHSCHAKGRQCWLYLALCPSVLTSHPHHYPVPQNHHPRGMGCIRHCAGSGAQQSR